MYSTRKLQVNIVLLLIVLVLYNISAGVTTNTRVVKRIQYRIEVPESENSPNPIRSRLCYDILIQLSAANEVIANMISCI